MDAAVDYRVERHAAWITLNRPDNRNALTSELSEALDEAMERAIADEAVRVLVLAAKGRHFCAGADVKAGGRGAVGSGGRHGSSPYVSVLNQMLEGPKPVVGRVQGGAFGGGLGLVTACDMVVAGDSARFAYSEVRLGLAPWMLSVVLQRKGALQPSAALMLTGERFGAKRARELFLAHRVVADDDLDAAVGEELEKLRAGGPNALREVKRIFRTVPGMPLADAFAYAEQASRTLFEAEEGAEGMAAFREKRKPAWAAE